jgi:hypothetical protein
MFGRRILLVAAMLGLAVGATAPAYAEEGLGVGTQFAGNVVATTFDPGSTTASPSNQWVSGDCNFEGATRGSGIEYVFGGHAVASSRDTDQPQYTELTCTISSLQGPGDPVPTQSMSVNIGFGGAASVAAGQTPVWPLRAVKICISGYAIFGPVTTVRVDIQTSCKTSALVP